MRNRNINRFMILLLLVVSVSFVAAAPAAAAPDRDVGCWTWDEGLSRIMVTYSDGECGAITRPGSTYTGTGWYGPDDGSFDNMIVRQELPSSLPVIRACILLENRDGAGGALAQIVLRDSDLNIVASGPLTTLSPGAPAADSCLYQWPPVDASYIEYRNYSVPGDDNLILRMSVEVEGSINPLLAVGASDIVRPMMEDEETSSEPASLDDKTSIYMDDTADIHAAFDGQITNVSAVLGIVVLETNDYIATYYNLDEIYVDTDQIVSAGCILGSARSAGDGERRLDFQLASVTGEEDEFGLPVIDEYLDYQDYDDPDGTVICGSEYGDTCINTNADLQSGAHGWVTTGSTIDDTVQLDYGESLRQDLLLDDETDYYLSMLVSAPLGGTLAYNLGYNADFKDNIELDPDSGFKLIRVGPGQMGEPDVGGDMYSLVIKSLSDNITIDYVCVHTDAQGTGPDTCYFGDSYDFSPTTGDWSVSGGAEFSNHILDSVVRIPDGGSLIHPVTLYGYTDSAVDYKLTIIARLAPNLASAAFWENDEYALMDVQIDTAADDYDLADPNITVDNFNSNHTYQVEWEIGAGETWSGDLIITNSFIPAAAEATEIVITAACISVDGARPFPTGTESEADAPPAFGTCEYECAVPDGVNVWEWLLYLSCWLGSVWNCDLFPLLLATRGYIAENWQTLMHLGTYLSLLASLVLGWLAENLIGIAEIAAIWVSNGLASFWNWLITTSVFEMFWDAALLAGAAAASIIDRLTTGALVISSGVLAAVASMTWSNGLLVVIAAAIDGAASVEISDFCELSPEDVRINMCYAWGMLDHLMVAFPALLAFATFEAAEAALNFVLSFINQVNEVLDGFS